MAKFNYAAMQKTAERLLDQFGFAATLVKRVQTGGTRMRPAETTETRHAVTIVDSDVRTKLRLVMQQPYNTEGGGLAIEGTERVLTMSTQGGVVPAVKDCLEIGGELQTIKEAAPYAPGGVTMFHSLTLE